jgi:hypothetical protein
MSSKKANNSSAALTSSPTVVVPSTLPEGLPEGRSSELVGEVQIVSLLYVLFCSFFFDL